MLWGFLEGYSHQIGWFSLVSYFKSLRIAFPEKFLTISVVAQWYEERAPSQPHRTGWRFCLAKTVIFCLALHRGINHTQIVRRDHVVVALSGAEVLNRINGTHGQLKSIIW